MTFDTRYAFLKIRYVTFICFVIFNCTQNIVFGENRFDEKKISDFLGNYSINRSFLSKEIHTQIELNKFISLLSNNIDNLEANNKNQLNNL